MTTFTAITDTTLAQDKPLTQSVARALRDNPLAIAQGDITAPRVSTLGISSQYMKVSRVAAQLYGSGTGSLLIFPDTKDFDPDNLFDIATGRFKPTVPGLYLVSAKITTGNSPASAVAVSIAKNGTEIDNVVVYSNVNNTFKVPQFTTIIPMNGTTDYLDFHTYPNGSFSYTFVGSFWAVALCEL